MNDECKRSFRIGEWERWDYDLDEQTLTFSEKGSPRVVAEIQVVGSTSEKAGTWLWSWANASLPEPVTAQIGQVRDFGEKERIAELTSAYADDNEHLGWAFTSVAARVLGAKGGYRCPSSNGFVYVVFIDLSFADLVQKNPGKIHCDRHGRGHETFICEHLLANPQQQWFSNPPVPEDRWPDAWCAACEALFLMQGEWNDQNSSQRKIVMVCHCCYEGLRSKSTP